jgi:uncharacterized protein (TIGR01777 family)
MKVTVTGSSGFLGSHLLPKLLEAGHQVHVAGRKRAASLPSEIAFSEWSASAEPPAGALSGSDAVVHLAGEPIAQRWTVQAKARIRESRVEGTRLLVSALRNLPERPSVLVCSSGISYYGSRGDEVLTETSSRGPGFLSDVVRDWEAAARSAEPLGIRVVCLRFGAILGHGGALAKMLPPFRLGLGGPIGSGSQWMSWIHIADAAGLIMFAAENDALRGPVNGTSSNPVTNRDFTRELGHALHRPTVLPVPELALKLIFGEMSSVILDSQRVLPKAAKQAGFRFQYPDLRSALSEILKPLRPV